MKFKDNRTKIMFIVFITVFIDMIGIGVLIPLYPMLVVPGSSFKITPVSWSIHSGFIMAGWLMAVYPLAQFFATPILGQFSDKYGRRKILAISIAGTTISYILFSIAIVYKNLPLLFVSRFLDGISGGNISIAQAIIGDVSKDKNSAKNFGLIGAALGLGFVFGPFLGGILSDSSITKLFNIYTPFIFAAILSGLNLVFVVCYLPETYIGKVKYPIKLTKSLLNIVDAFTLKDLNVVFLTSFLFNAGFASFTTFWGIILADKYKFTQTQIGGFFAYMGLMIIFSQGVVVRKISAKSRDFKVLQYSIFGSALCLLAYYFVSLKYVSFIYYITISLAIFIALSKAFTMSLINRLCPTEHRGEVMGVNSSINALAQSIPAILAGYIATYHTSLPVLVGAILLFIASVIFTYLYQTR